jgi:hypothetical protein
VSINLGRRLRERLDPGRKPKESLSLGVNLRAVLNLGRNQQEMLSLGARAMGVRKNPGLKAGGIRADIKDEVMGRLIYGIGKYEALSYTTENNLNSHHIRKFF